MGQYLTQQGSSYAYAPPYPPVCHLATITAPFTLVGLEKEEEDGGKEEVQRRADKNGEVEQTLGGPERGRGSIEEPQFVRAQCPMSTPTLQGTSMDGLLLLSNLGGQFLSQPESAWAGKGSASTKLSSEPLSLL